MVLRGDLEMSKADKTLEKLLGGRQDANIGFEEVRGLLKKLGFTERIRGSHHNYRRDGFDALNLQPAGHMAKSYQIKQVRDALRKGGF